MQPSAGPEPFSIEQHERDDEALLISVRGELDMTTAPALQRVFGDVASRRRTAVLDLSHLEFIDSTGLRIVLEALEDARRDGWSLLVAPSLPFPVERLIDIVGVRDLLPFADTA